MPWSFGLLKFLTPPKEAQLWSCRPKNGKRANFLKVWLQDSKIYGKWTKMSCIVAFYFVQNYGETPLRHCPNGDGIQDRGQARQAPKITKKPQCRCGIIMYPVRHIWWAENKPYFHVIANESYWDPRYSMTTGGFCHPWRGPAIDPALCNS